MHDINDSVKSSESKSCKHVFSEFKEENYLKLLLDSYGGLTHSGIILRRF
jgi:hypothetical protein